MSRFRRDAQAGFSLIELMISMVLGLLVLGAAIAVFQSNQSTFNANEGQNRIQEGARAAYEMISRDIRAAGGTACSKQARPDEEHAYTVDETNLMTAPVYCPPQPDGLFFVPMKLHISSISTSDSSVAGIGLSALS